jgi:hypothetical protein
MKKIAQKAKKPIVLLCILIGFLLIIDFKKDETTITVSINHHPLSSARSKDIL